MIDVSTPDRKATVLLLLAIAGCVDAVGLAETGRYFVSFMSGNTTQMGLSLAYREFADVWLPLGLIALFVAGSTIGTLIAEQAGARAAAGVLMLAEAALIASAYWGFQSPRPGSGLILLPVAMGLANIVTLQAGTPHPGTTYATGALVRLGILLAGIGKDVRPGAVAYQLAMWIALLVGSILGAFGRLRFGNDTLLAPVALLVFLGAIELTLSRRRST